MDRSAFCLHTLKCKKFIILLQKNTYTAVAAASIFLSDIWRRFIRKLRFYSFQLTGWKQCFICKCFIWYSNFAHKLNWQLCMETAIVAVLSNFFCAFYWVLKREIQNPLKTQSHKHLEPGLIQCSGCGLFLVGTKVGWLTSLHLKPKVDKQ